MRQHYTAIYKKKAGWYLGWVEEIPGVNTQGKTLQETRENLSEALHLILEVNRELTHTIIPGKAVREVVTIQSKNHEEKGAHSLSS